MIFNDENLPNDKVELALAKIITIVRRKIGDWLPSEGKAGEDASRLLSEGKLENRSSGGGYGTPNSYGNENGGNYGSRSNAGYQNQPATPNNAYQQSANSTANGAPAQYDRAGTISGPPSPVDTFPTQVSLHR